MIGGIGSAMSTHIVNLSRERDEGGGRGIEKGRGLDGEDWGGSTLIVGEMEI